MHGHLMSREYRDIFKEIRMQIIREQLSKIRYHQNLLKANSEFLVQTKFWGSGRAICDSFLKPRIAVSGSVHNGVPGRLSSF